MKFGKCCMCNNIRHDKNKCWCKKHNKEINDKDVVICAFYSEKIR